MTDNVQDFGPSDFTIQVGPMNAGEASPVVKVTWCISARLAEYLREQEAREPHVLIVVASDNNHRFQQHVVEPLGPGMAIIGLRSKGINTVHATVVWRKRGEESPRAYFKRRRTHELVHPDLDGLYELRAERDKLIQQRDETDPGEYVGGDAADEVEASPLQPQIDALNDKIDKCYDLPKEVAIPGSFSYVIGRAPVTVDVDVDVDVPGSAFAKEPPRAVKWLANFASRRTFIDECHMKKYAIYGGLKLAGFALATPFWLAWKLIGLAGILLLLLMGERGINYRAWWSWRYNNLTDISMNVHHSVWIWKAVPVAQEGSRADSSYEERGPWSLFLNPPVAVAVGLIAWLVFWVHDPILNAFLAAVAFIALVGVVAITIAILRSKSDARQAALRKDRARLEHDLKSLVCQTPRQSGVVASELRPVRETVRLRFGEVKAAVCRPFAQ